jgi:hypothetical protein
MAADGNARFRDELWESIENGILQKIKAHPFIKGIVDGSLDEHIFRCSFQKCSTTHPTLSAAWQAPNNTFLISEMSAPCACEGAVICRIVAMPQQLRTLAMKPWVKWRIRDSCA